MELQIRQLTKRYGTKTTLDQFSYTFTPTHPYEAGLTGGR